MTDAAQARSRYIAFFDECGDHSLESIDADFPVFVLSTVVVERTAYETIVVPAFAKLKLRYWDHEGINLHSRDIRKAYGDCSFLQDKEQRQQFMADLSRMMEDLPYTLFIAGISKDKHVERYGPAALNPYSLSLEFALERIVHFLEQAGEQSLPFIAEARGKNEDRDLRAAFHQLMQRGTRFVAAERFQRILCPLSFRRKYDNIAGMQLADLCAHPCARQMLFPDQPNRACAVVQKHLYRHGRTNGWKVFP